MAEVGQAAETFEALRPLLFSIAYRMLASASEAEDVVQEAFLRYQRALAEGTAIDSPKAYLAAVATRLAIDQVRSARMRRETYIGEWLPEPVLTDGHGSAGGIAATAELADPAAHVELADAISMAFLLLLQRLSPVERAVFLLHDVLGFGYDEIARIVGKTEANCRQLALRARRRIASERPRFDASAKERDALAARFFAAVHGGDLEGLIEMLAADAVVHGDGGGKAVQWAAPVVGAERATRLLAGLGRQIREHGLTVQRRQVNGQPGAVVLDPEGRLVSIFSLEIAGGLVRAFRSVINPDKLDHLGYPLSDIARLDRQTN
jgi:RNA polymerase sigma-70 factor (ECF subfamily)